MGKRQAVIEIPGEATFWKTVDLLPVEVSLPLQARARVGLLGWSLLMPLSALSGVGTVLLFPSLLTELSRADGSLKLIGWLSIYLFVAVMAVGFCGAFITLLVDRFRIGHCLRIDPDRLTDLRASHDAFQFKDVVRAQAMISRSGVAAVRLHFRSKVDVHHNPLRIGTIMFPLRRSENELHLPLLGLDIAPRTLALVILKLVKAHGASIEHAWPERGDWVLQDDVRQI